MDNVCDEGLVHGQEGDVDKTGALIAYAFQIQSLIGGPHHAEHGFGQKR